MKIRYSGPFAEVQIAQTGQMVERGDAVEVDHQLGLSLTKQEFWNRVKTQKKDEDEEG